ncbi:MAG: hypothetical protein K8S16_21385 [Bacteroidales bacterium]|nr:hypothetical protein [Bacteroidales bacterium]
MKNHTNLQKLLFLIVFVSVILSCNKEKEIYSDSEILQKSNIEGEKIFTEHILPKLFADGVFDKIFVSPDESLNFTENSGNTSFTNWQPEFGWGNSPLEPGTMSAKIDKVHWSSNEAYAFNYSNYITISGTNEDGYYIALTLLYEYVASNTSLSINHGVYSASYGNYYTGLFYYTFETAFVNITYYSGNIISGNFEFQTFPSGSYFPVTVTNGLFNDVPISKLDF